MSQFWALSARAVRETLRVPEQLIPTVLIPLFFLVVNVGQAAKVFPGSSTPFLEGQSYGAFQLPSSLLLAGSFGVGALFLVEDIESGYFDKLRAAPVSRTALVLSRLVSEAVKGAVLAIAMIALALPFGIRVASGPLGLVAIVLLTAGWTVVFGAFMQLIALKTRTAAATQSGSLVFFPLLFLTPGFVPRDLLARPMEVAASLNPVTYVMEAMRALILQESGWGDAVTGTLVVLVLGVLVVSLNVRLVRRYD